MSEAGEWLPAAVMLVLGGAGLTGFVKWLQKFTTLLLKQMAAQEIACREERERSRVAFLAALAEDQRLRHDMRGTLHALVLVMAKNGHDVGG